TARANRQSLFSEIIDDLVKLAPCPAMLVRGVADDEDWRPRRILVPVNGTAAARRAAGLAFARAAADGERTGTHCVTPAPGAGPRATEPAFAMADEGVEMTAIHVVTPSPGAVPRGDLAVEVTAEMEKVGLALGKVASTHIRRADDPETGIMAAIEEFQPDLLV